MRLRMIRKSSATRLSAIVLVLSLANAQLARSDNGLICFSREEVEEFDACLQAEKYFLKEIHELEEGQGFWETETGRVLIFTIGFGLGFALSNSKK